MSFLVASSYAQSSVVKNDLRSDLQAKKSTGSLNIQDDESVPFCHTGLELVTVLTAVRMETGKLSGLTGLG